MLICANLFSVIRFPPSTPNLPCSIRLPNERKQHLFRCVTTICKFPYFIRSLQNLALSPEDLDILDIDWIRWQNKSYTLRADEVDEMGSLLEALSFACGEGVLVLGPSYAFEAERVRIVDWMPSDDEPIDATGAVRSFGYTQLLRFD